MLACCTNHFFNTDIYSFSTYYTLGWWGRSIVCQCSNFSSILHFFNMCWWKFDIIIIFFNAIALALQTSRVCLTNWYLILKPLVLDSFSKLYDNRYLPQNRYFLLPPSLSYFHNGLFHPFHSFHSLHPSYPFHPLHPFDPPYIVLSHSRSQGV